MEQLIEITAVDVWIPERGVKIKKECKKRFDLRDIDRLKRLLKAKTKHANSEVFLHYKKLENESQTKTKPQRI